MDGGPPRVFVEQSGFSPWGIVFDAKGRCWWSGTGGIANYDGNANRVLVSADEVTTPTALAISPEGVLACSSLGRQSVTLWDIAGATPRLLHTMRDAVNGPAGIAFTTHPFAPAAQFGNFVPKPSNTGRDWTPTGTTVYNLRADPFTAALSEFGIDTEGGDRAKTQLLREPMRLVFTLPDGKQIHSSDLEAKRRLAAGRVEFTCAPLPTWRPIGRCGSKEKRSECESPSKGTPPSGSPRPNCTSPSIRGRWARRSWPSGGAEGAVEAPLIISALDMGQLRLSGEGGEERLPCRFTGSRQHKRIDLRVELLGGDGERRIAFVPARLEKPMARCPLRSGPRSGGTDLPDPDHALHEAAGRRLRLVRIAGGHYRNNVISDPVSCNMDRNLQWLAGRALVAATTRHRSLPSSTPVPTTKVVPARDTWSNRATNT